MSVESQILINPIKHLQVKIRARAHTYRERDGERETPVDLYSQQFIKVRFLVIIIPERSQNNSC